MEEGTLIQENCMLIFNSYKNIVYPVDFSLAELGIVGLVAFILLGQKDFLELLRVIKFLKNKIKNYYNCYLADYNEIIVNEKVVDFMLDKEGKVQKMYDNKEITSVLKKKQENESA